VSTLQDRLASALGTAFRLEQELGGGGMSRVFLAEEVGLGRKVVIKVLPPEMSAAVNQERFRREIQLAARLQHPHIVPLLSAGSSDDLLYYVMPLVEGESLRVKLAREMELPVTEAVRILREVTDALRYAHEHGVVHRDIKPDNVLLSHGHALVTDFGVAKAVSASGDAAHTMTSLGVALGTPAYMAPEQASADPHVDHRADIYALGVLVYEMLAGRPPFVGATPQALLAAHLTQTPDRLSAQRPAVPAALDAVVMRCLEKRPADRWQTAGELLPQLDALLTPGSGTQPVGVAPTISSGTEAALRATHPVRVTLLFALASLAVLSVAAWLVQRLGLPSWVVPAAASLLVIGLPIMLLTARQERARLEARRTGSHPTEPSGLAGRLLTWRGALAGGGIALGGLALGTVAFMALRAAGIGPFATLLTAGVLKERDPLVLASFHNRTSDSTLGESITEAFRIDLSQSPVVRLLENTAVDAALARMKRDPAAPLSEDVARDLAQREGAKAVVAGEVAPLGSGYVLTVRLIGAADGTTLRAGRETANDASGIIPAVERLSRKLREGMGESLRNIRAARPLDQVTTTSLGALRLYAEGARLNDETRFREAVRPLEQAVALDSNFGMAWRKLGVALGNSGVDPTRSLAALTRAYEMRDRMPPREALHAEAYMYFGPWRNRRKAIELFERILATWPDDYIALGDLAISYNREGRFADAERAAQRSLEVAGPNGLDYLSVVTARIGQRRLAGAESTLASWQRESPNAMARLDVGANVAREQGNYVKALALADSLSKRSSPDAIMRGSTIGRVTYTLLGRLREAERATQGALHATETAGQVGQYLALTADLATAEAILLDRSQAAVERMQRALARHPLDSVPPRNRPYGALAQFYAAAGRTQLAQSMLAEYERSVPDARQNPNPASVLATALLAIAQRDGRAALAALDRGQELAGCILCTELQRGQAYELLNQPDSALAGYERLANTPNLNIEGRQIDLPAALRRAGEMYEIKGDRNKALEYYGRFVDLWKDADPELQPLVRQVRQHMAELASERPRAR
jgi:tetratricopeptide (TPR) repeat protein/tRNA A-37 threonylcarbamoyl transferase component Bud32